MYKDKGDVEKVLMQASNDIIDDDDNIVEKQQEFMNLGRHEVVVNVMK